MALLRQGPCGARVRSPCVTGAPTFRVGHINAALKSIVLCTPTATALGPGPFVGRNPSQTCPSSFAPLRATVSDQAQAVATTDVTDFILSGPLLAPCNITAESVSANLTQWQAYGQQLASQLNFDHDNLSPAQRSRIYHYYLPVYFWVADQLRQLRAQGNQTQALVVGISAPQGCGKTTLVEQLVQLCTFAGHRAASVSIDDFYLTYADQTALAAANPGNRLLELRGNAGTHDLALGTETIKTLRGLSQPGASAKIPRYDKSAYGGRGDRHDPSQWPQVEGPLELVFFEGWMSGFAPVEPAAAAGVDPSLAAVNEQLRSYKAAWDELVDSWLVIRIGDPQWVYQWRQEAEDQMISSGRKGMSAQQIADFVSRFMPAYTAYLPGLYSRGPTTAQPGHTLIIEVNQTRSPVAQQPKPVV